MYWLYQLEKNGVIFFYSWYGLYVFYVTKRIFGCEFNVWFLGFFFVYEKMFVRLLCFYFQKNLFEVLVVLRYNISDIGKFI